MVQLDISHVGNMRVANNRKDLSGMVFNNLTVLSYSHTEGKRAYWKCICECGKEKVAQGKLVVSGNVKSCGCLNHIGSNLKHGSSGTSEYGSWNSMRSRCNNPNYPKYKDYGARGITIDERWNDFENFLTDMGVKPSPKHTIERKDVNGNYTKDNCHWATAKEQGMNKRNTAILMNTQNGVFYHSYPQAAESVGLTAGCLYAKLNGIVKNTTNLMVV